MIHLDAEDPVTVSRRHALSTLGTAIAALLVAGLVVPSTSHSVEPSGSERAVDAVTNDERLVTLLMPVSIEEKRASERLDALASAVQIAAASDCQEAEGFAPLPGRGRLLALPETSHRRYYEDARSLELTGLTGAAAPLNLPPEASPDYRPPGETRPDAPAEAQRACAAEGRRASEELAEVVGTVGVAWSRTVERLEGSRSLRPAMRGFVECMNRFGHQIASEPEVFDEVTRSGADIVETDRRLGLDYAACLEAGLARARVDVRTRARTRFVADHRAELDRAARVLPGLVQRLAVRHRIEGVTDLVPVDDALDASGWTKRSLAEAGFGVGASVEAVASGAHGFVAAGFADSGRRALATWTSDDGLSWRHSAPFQVDGTETSSLLVAGSADALTMIAVDSQRREVRAVFTSRTGAGWRPGTVAAFDGAVVTDVVGGRRGFAAIGYEPIGRAEIGPAVAWYSADGRLWVRSRVPDTRAPGRVAPLGHGFVAAGGVGERPVTWYSPDGKEWVETTPPIPAPTSSSTSVREWAACSRSRNHRACSAPRSGSPRMDRRGNRSQASTRSTRRGAATMSPSRRARG